LGVRTITNSIPSELTYRTVPAASEDAIFLGRWGLEKLGIEAGIAGEGCGADCVTVGILDLLGAISDYVSGDIDVLELLDIIQRYKNSR
jgi:hypothetical protein